MSSSSATSFTVTPLFDCTARTSFVVWHVIYNEGFSTSQATPCASSAFASSSAHLSLLLGRSMSSPHTNSSSPTNSLSLFEILVQASSRFHFLCEGGSQHEQPLPQHSESLTQTENSASLFPQAIPQKKSCRARAPSDGEDPRSTRSLSEATLSLQSSCIVSVATPYP